MKYLKIYLTSFTVFLEILKKKKNSEKKKKALKKKGLKKTSQLVIFRAFLSIFFRPPDPRSDKKSRKSTNKKNLA